MAIDNFLGQLDSIPKLDSCSTGHFVSGLGKERLEMLSIIVVGGPENAQKYEITRLEKKIREQIILSDFSHHS